ncbi:MAG: hypothetical protein AVO39_02190 [delta proteobacterium MLS_D]|jgi:hypothetical protein|nr:MAG: hypothetical protein AVO39_02190 [delta proteobacterium MLS_D]
MKSKTKTVLAWCGAIIIVAVVAAMVLLYLTGNDSGDAAKYSRTEKPIHIGEITNGAAQDRVVSAKGEERPMSSGESSASTGRTGIDENNDGKDAYQKHLEAIRSFCSYLDEQDYVKKYDVTEGVYFRMLAVIDKLSRHTPSPVAEASDTMRLTANLFHFYRVMGRKDTLLAAEILLRERDRIEAIFPHLYGWLMLDCRHPRPRTSVSLETLYEYGAYFLTSLGGRSYLARRDSKIGFLVRYYSLLVVEQADAQQKNYYGVDLLPYAEMLAVDATVISGLEHKPGYEAKLKEIRGKLLTR